MRRILFALTVSAFAAVAAPAAVGAQDVSATPVSGEAQAVPLRLPAALYDVIGVWDLGWGDAPGRGRPTATAAVATQRVVRGPNGSPVVRNAPAQVGQAALSRFMVSADSILYNRGSDWAEIAVAEITSLEEVRWPQNNHRSWVRVTWVARNVEQTIYLRQANASSQATFLATLRKAIELNRASATR